MATSNAIPQPICIPRKDVNALLGMSHNGSFRYFPPRRAKGMVLRSDVMAFLSRTSRNGAPIDFIPDDLLSLGEAAAVTGFTTRRLHSWASSKRMKLPHYYVNRKSILFREGDLLSAIGAPSKVEVPNRWERREDGGEGENDLTHALNRNVGNSEEGQTNSPSTGEALVSPTAGRR